MNNVQYSSICSIRCQMSHSLFTLVAFTAGNFNKCNQLTEVSFEGTNISAQNIQNGFKMIVGQFDK